MPDYAAVRSCWKHDGRRSASGSRYGAEVRIVVDASDTMVALGEVAVWSFELGAWGECVQARTQSAAVASFGSRVQRPPATLVVGERISGPGAVFSEDLLPATDAQIARTIEILDSQRSRRSSMLVGVTDDELDREDVGVQQPSWMTWRTPRTILRHIVDTESRAYPRWCGLPQLDSVEDLHDELERSAEHIRQVLESMPRTFRTEHRGETWTPVKLLRRLAWHERIELVFLRRRLDTRRTTRVPPLPRHRPPSES